MFTLRRTLIALSLILTPTLAVASIHLTDKGAEIARRDHLALVADRMAGTWVLDAELTRKLAPSPNTIVHDRIVFFPGQRAQQAAMLAMGRLSDPSVFGGGQAWFDGNWHLYLLVDTGVELRLFLFTSTRDDHFGRVTSLAFCMELTRKGVGDQLFLAGAAPRKAELAYERPQRGGKDGQPSDGK